MNKDSVMRLRLEGNRKAVYEAQAEKEGMTLSQWIRAVLDARSAQVGGVKHKSVKEQMDEILGEGLK